MVFLWGGRGGSPSFWDRRFCTEHSAYEDSVVRSLLIVPFVFGFSSHAVILGALPSPTP